jgi:hypothetical protein
MVFWLGDRRTESLLVLAAEVSSSGAARPEIRTTGQKSHDQVGTYRTSLLLPFSEYTGDYS